MSAAFVTKQKSLGWSKHRKGNEQEFVESIALGERTNETYTDERKTMQLHCLESGCAISALLLLSLLEATV